VFPIVIDSHIVIPPGSYVTGTVTEVKRPGRVRGRGELYVRFDSLTLPNGITRDFRSRLGGIDARGTEHLDKKEGKIQGDSDKGSDARMIGEGAASGASIGAIAGSAAGHAGLGAGIGGGAGAAAGLAGVLLTRGPEAVLAKGSTIEMVLDRPLTFNSSEVNFTTMAGGAGHFSDGSGPTPTNSRNLPNPMRRLPF
jgi:type IV secretion system protein VirB10